MIDLSQPPSANVICALVATFLLLFLWIWAAVSKIHDLGRYNLGVGRATNIGACVLGVAAAFYTHNSPLEEDAQVTYLGGPCADAIMHNVTRILDAYTIESADSRPLVWMAAATALLAVVAGLIGCCCAAHRELTTVNLDATGHIRPEALAPHIERALASRDRAATKHEPIPCSACGEEGGPMVHFACGNSIHRTRRCMPAVFLRACEPRCPQCAECEDDVPNTEINTHYSACAVVVAAIREKDGMPHERAVATMAVSTLLFHHAAHEIDRADAYAEYLELDEELADEKAQMALRCLEEELPRPCAACSKYDECAVHYVCGASFHKECSPRHPRECPQCGAPKGGSPFGVNAHYLACHAGTAVMQECKNWTIDSAEAVEMLDRPRFYRHMCSRAWKVLSEKE